MRSWIAWKKLMQLRLIPARSDDDPETIDDEEGEPINAEDRQPIHLEGS